jgi:hypothetical protein
MLYVHAQFVALPQLSVLDVPLLLLVLVEICCVVVRSPRLGWRT